MSGRAKLVPSTQEEGVLLLGLRIEFYARATDEAWRDLAAKLSSRPISTDGGWSVSFTGLPSTVEPGDYYLYGDAHSYSKVAGEAHWFIGVAVAPNATPPPPLREQSEKVGGIEGLRELLFRGWPGPQRVSASIRVTMGLDTRRWHYRLEEPQVERREREGTVTAVLVRRQIDWQISGGGPLREVKDIGMLPGDHIGLILEGKARLAVGPELLANAEKKLWTALRKSFLQPRD